MVVLLYLLKNILMAILLLAPFITYFLKYKSLPPKFYLSHYLCNELCLNY